MSKQQIAIFEQAMRMLTPFYIEEPTKREKPTEPQTSAAEAQIQELRSHLNQIQKQLDELVSGRDK
jgi:polyhydroxyalkanoate synthesis regulator protein